MANRVPNNRIRFRTLASNIGRVSVIQSLFRSISLVAASRSSTSSRSRVSSLFFVLALVLDGLRRRLTFGALGRFVFVVVRRRFFMASLSAAHVPIAAMLPPRHRDYQEYPAAS